MDLSLPATDDKILRPMKKALLPALLLILFSSLSPAWTSRTYQMVVVKSTKLMPVSFQRIMRKHREEILRGSLKPDDRGEEFHRYNLESRDGFLKDQISTLTKSIPEKMAAHRPFREVAEDFGRLSHYIADLNDPLLLEDQDPRESKYRIDFAVYAEKNMEKFPWVFDGHEAPMLSDGNLNEYLYQIASSTARKYPRLGEAYFPNGQLVSSDTFDARSLPFGIASLSYSHSITHTVQVWFYTWKQGHGDITHTPLYKSGKDQEKP